MSRCCSNSNSSDNNTYNKHNRRGNHPSKSVSKTQATTTLAVLGLLYLPANLQLSADLVSPANDLTWGVHQVPAAQHLRYVRIAVSLPLHITTTVVLTYRQPVSAAHHPHTAPTHTHSQAQYLLIRGMSATWDTRFLAGKHFPAPVALA